jgi:hypothetical protein
VRNGRGADATLVGPGTLAAGDVDNQLQIAVGHKVQQIGAALLQLQHPLHANSGGLQAFGRAASLLFFICRTRAKL